MEDKSGLGSKEESALPAVQVSTSPGEGFGQFAAQVVHVQRFAQAGGGAHLQNAPDDRLGIVAGDGDHAGISEERIRFNAAANLETI